jgi:HEAT repeat protein
VRIIAINGLVGLKDLRAVPSLQRILKTAKDAVMRERAAQALQEMTGERVLFRDSEGRLKAPGRATY